jgi:hypothetical protein
VQELGELFERGAFDLFLEVVFNRLHIVVGGAFDCLDRLGFLRGEIFDYAHE